MQATRKGFVTLMGLIGPFTYPLNKGNAFSVFTEEAENKDRAVLNMYSENLDELIHRGIVQFPIEIAPVAGDRAVIIDSRIPKEWFHI